MESMTNAPYLLQKGRGGYRIGHDRIFDHMMLDGLEDAYEPGRSMGTFGEDCAAKYQFTRAQQDAFATASVQRAQAAITSGAFEAEIAPVTVKGRGGETVIRTDEGPGKIKLDKIPSLKPAFKKDGTVTAASSSSINDGAAAMLLMRQSTARPHRRDREHNRPPQGRGGRSTGRGRVRKAFGRTGARSGAAQCGSDSIEAASPASFFSAYRRSQFSQLLPLAASLPVKASVRIEASGTVTRALDSVGSTRMHDLAGGSVTASKA